MGFDTLWAPWRLAYIRGEDASQPKNVEPLELPDGADPDCFICQAAAAPEDPQRHVVYRDQRVLIVLNRYPYNNGHLLVAPVAHCARLDKLSEADHLAIAQTVSRMVGLLEKLLEAEGFNVGLNLGRVAGAGLPGHLHWHIVPRWNGDTNYMPVLGSVNVIPQSLDELWRLLRGALSEEAGQDLSA